MASWNSFRFVFFRSFHSIPHSSALLLLFCEPCPDSCAFSESFSLVWLTKRMVEYTQAGVLRFHSFHFQLFFIFYFNFLSRLFIVKPTQKKNSIHLSGCPHQRCCAAPSFTRINTFVVVDVDSFFFSSSSALHFISMDGVMRSEMNIYRNAGSDVDEKFMNLLLCTSWLLLNCSAHFAPAVERVWVGSTSYEAAIELARKPLKFHARLGRPLKDDSMPLQLNWFPPNYCFIADAGLFLSLSILTEAQQHSIDTFTIQYFFILCDFCVVGRIQMAR